MGVTDPRKLALILRDLEDELQRWSLKASDILSSATYTQMITREATHQARRQTLITTDQYYEDEREYRSRKQNVEDLLNKYEDAVKAAALLISDVEKKVTYAQQVLAKWTDELEKAIAWQKRAEARVRRAEAELAAAESALSSAESALASAEYQLQKCRNTVYEERNSEGKVVRRTQPDCSGYASAVSRCQNQVTACQQRVKQARIEVQAARSELARATARVNACAEAVEKAEQGVEVAKLSLQRANNALSQAERALDHVRAAERAVTRAGEILHEEYIRVDDMNVNMHLGEDRLNEAQNHLISSTRYEESAQRYRIMGRSELQHRIDVLYALNRPELLGGISGDGWVAGAIQFGGSTTKTAGGASKTPPQEVAVSNDFLKDGAWRGVEAVIAVSDLPDVPELDQDDAAKKFPQNKMLTMLHLLEEMIPLIEDGIGQNVEFWISRDKETGRDPKSGYGTTYEEYYTTFPITIAKLEDDSLVIVNGKERVWMAKKEHISHLPIQLMTRPNYLQPIRFTHTSSDVYEVRVYETNDLLSLRIYNTTRRNKIPDVMTDGDAVCLDVTFDKTEVQITRFDRRDHGFDDEALRFIEAICREKKMSSIVLLQPRGLVNTPEKRDWFLSLGYKMNEESSHMIFYKTLN